MARERPERQPRPVREPLPGADPQETLAWESAHRTRAAIAATIAGVFTFGGGILALTASRDLPSIGVVQALTPALNGQQDSATSPRTGIAQFLADHTFVLALAGVLTAIGALAAGYALLFLLRATVARRPEVPAFARWVVIVGAGAYALTSILLPLIRCLRAQDYIDGGERTRHAVNQAFGGPVLDVLAGVSIAGQLAFALSFVLVCINAQRCGLLTRFMGILGMLVGALYVLQIGNLPVVQAFWLVALVPVFLGQGRSAPPAWKTGKAMPWPSQAEQREARLREQQGKRADGAPDPTLEDAFDRGAEPAPAPRATTTRKRRKRR